MIKHIVFIKLKGVASEEEKTAHLLKLKEALDALPAQIPEIKRFQSGINNSDSPSAADLALIGEFEDKESLNIYRNHPEHKKVLELISSIKGRTSVVDFDF